MTEEAKEPRAERPDQGHPVGRASPASVVIKVAERQHCRLPGDRGVFHNVFSNGCLLGLRLLGKGSSAALGTEIFTTGFSFKVCSGTVG